MRYRLLGESGLRVSEISLGTMTFGEEWGWGAAVELGFPHEFYTMEMPRNLAHGGMRDRILA